MKKLAWLRYVLEWISVPVFAFLVIHLVGEGMTLLLEGGHGHHDHHHHDHGGEFFSKTSLFGLVGLTAFVAIWHLPFFKKLVPCSHDHCHHQTWWPHALASLAFILHLFPESEIRAEVLADFSTENWFSVVTLIGFGSHFLVDLVVVVLLTSFWHAWWQKLASLVFFGTGFALAFWFGHQGGLSFGGLGTPLLFLVSGFLLTMFIHWPHKPKPDCGSCG